MKIATWNLQRPSTTGARVDALMNQIRAIDADIWILTETRDNIDLRTDGYQSATSSEIASMHQPGERRTTIWSRYPIVKAIATHCAETAVCVELGETPVGPMIVYGTIIPYGNAAGQYAYHSAGQKRKGLKAWELHYESIALHQRDLVALREGFPNHVRCFAGDLNQSRDGRKWWNSERQWYGTQKGRDLLTACLDAAGLKCVTEEDLVGAGKLKTMSTVDHICLNHALESTHSSVGAWEAPQVTASSLASDHCGIWIALDSRE